MNRWSLECLIGESGQIERLPLRRFPLKIGRGEEADVTIEATDVSRLHAELTSVGEQLWLQDMGSTNGTFVNHQRINDAVVLQAGDVVHFAHVEARVIDEDKPGAFVSTSTLVMEGDLSTRIPLGSRELRYLLEHRQVTPMFQPIVDMQGRHVAYEMLVRGAHPNLLPNPGALFHIAESIGKAAELSELFREVGISEAQNSGLTLPIYVNTHPEEMKNPERLLASLQCAQNRDLSLVIEIHEQAVTDIAEMQSLAANIKSMGMDLAYDDFGAGQARLLELTEATPEVVKFDIALIRNIHKTGTHKQQLLELLVSMVKKMGIRALAEGVSLKEEAEVCERLGFDLMQGFSFGYPLPLDEWKHHFLEPDRK